MAANNTADVSNVKGVQGGYGFSAPYGTTVGTTQDPFGTSRHLHTPNFVLLCAIPTHGADCMYLPLGCLVKESFPWD